MLCLSRKVGQKILIYPNDKAKQMTVEELFGDGPICLEVLKIKGSQMKIAIKATEDLVVVREEIS